MSPSRVWLDVPFAEKDEAKALGARWDASTRRWYTPTPNKALSRWEARPEIPDLLPGEDRSFGAGLFVDLVPSSCWFTNVRSCVSQQDWERLRRMITRRADHRCEACGRGEDRAAKRWLEAHERWEYSENPRTQTLRRLVCLCSDCHTTTHMGLAHLQGKGPAAQDHLRAVTGMTVAAAEAHTRDAFALWNERSRHDWVLDLSILLHAGVTLAPPPQAKTRTKRAEPESESPRTPPPSPPRTPKTKKPG